MDELNDPNVRITTPFPDPSRHGNRVYAVYSDDDRVMAIYFYKGAAQERAIATGGYVKELPYQPYR